MSIYAGLERRRWNWLGHILRREGIDDCKTALGWKPEGKEHEEGLRPHGGEPWKKKGMHLDGPAGIQPK